MARTRHIVLDTETTGLDVQEGHRVVEIGALELINYVPSGETFHVYLNPERAMDESAYNVHGLGDAFLADKPTFQQTVRSFLDFIADSALVIHNAPFDVGFLNAELERAGHERLAPGRIIDTLERARRRFPGARNSLDALCQRFGIDNARRTLHGALLDAELLAEVFLELEGGRQPGLTLAGDSGRRSDRLDEATMAGTGSDRIGPRRHEPLTPRPHQPSAAEAEAHQALIARLKDPLWESGGDPEGPQQIGDGTTP